MCGIAGFLDAGGTLTGASLASTGLAMARTLRHRGPDDSGIWVDAAVGISLAHRRLAIVDLSAAGRQPMRSSCGRFVLTYNGEIYNHVELRQELAAAGRMFRGHSDSQVLVEGCAHWGVEATLGRLNGMFAFAAWDRSTRTLYLARDRVGIKPLYWARFGRLLLFGSELKALRAHSGWEPEIDRRSLRAYMRRGHVPSPFSIYRGVRKLEAGELLVCGPGVRLHSIRYWDPARVVAAAGADRLDVGETEALHGLDTLLRDAVGRHMVADVPLGAFLSGGIDSSLVVALMQAQSKRPVNTFTVGFGEERFDEATHARAVAKYLGTAHTEARILPTDALRLVPEFARWFDEPMASRSQIPTMLVSALARRHVTVALSGDGGDELFGGYVKYYLMGAVARAIGGMPTPVRRAAADAVAAALSGVAAMHGWLPHEWRPALPLNKIGTIVAAVRATGDLNAVYRETRNAALAPSALLIGEDEHPLRWETGPHGGIVSDAMERMGYFDFLTLLVDGILTKVDRASMAHSLEVRVPLLDHRVVEYAWRLPPKLKYGRSSENKRLLRRLLYRYVPRGLVDRPKKGFSSPIAIWLRGPLRGWAEDLLDERRINDGGFFDGARVRACWDQHRSGIADHWRLLWGILMFEQWRLQWMTGPANESDVRPSDDLPAHEALAVAAR